jgi:hypothetical protein
VTPTSAGEGIEDVVDPEGTTGTPKVPQNSESEGSFEDPLAPDDDDPSASGTAAADDSSSEHDTAEGSGVEGGELRPDERMLLEGILMMMNREHPDFTLAEEGMEELVNRVDVDVDELIDEGYIEKHGLFGLQGRDYYTVLEKGRKHLNRDLKWEQGTDQQEGEVRTPRIVAHEMAKQWLKENYQVEEWYSTDEGVVDLVGSSDGTIQCSVAIREEGFKKDPVEIYQTLEDVPGESVWIYMKSSEVQSDIRGLARDGYVETNNESWSLDNVRESLQEQNSEGMDCLYSLIEIRDIIQTE